MANILLINPSWGQRYKNYLSSSFFHSVLKLSTIAAQAKKNSHKINITGLIVGFIGATLIFSQVTHLIKSNKKINRNIFIIGCRPHCPLLPDGYDEADIVSFKLNLVVSKSSSRTIYL